MSNKAATPDLGEDAACTCRGCVVQLERDEARAAMKRVRALHRHEWDDSQSAPVRCVHDGAMWPCPTIAALELS